MEFEGFAEKCGANYGSDPGLENLAGDHARVSEDEKSD